MTLTVPHMDAVKIDTMEVTIVYGIIVLNNKNIADLQKLIFSTAGRA